MLDDPRLSVKAASSSLTSRLIRDKRRAKGLTQADVARALNIDYRKISDWESGRIKNVPPQYKEQLFAFLGIEEQSMDMVEVILPQIALSEYEEPHLRLATEFLMYVLEGIHTPGFKEYFKLKDYQKYPEAKYEMRELLEHFLLSKTRNSI